MKKSRLDQRVFELGLVESRERAKTTIMSGLVFVNGQRADKPGTSVSDESLIEIKGEKLKFVSRGGLKLEKALIEFNVDPKGLVCIDCGASTGGFTDCLLQNGARRVYSVDVGYGQLAWKLRNDDRVVSMERTNIRNLMPDDLPEKPQLAVMDLSFISLGLVLPVVKRLLADDGSVICLIKPQFEAGREKVGKKGVVRDAEVHTEVLRSFLGSAKKTGFSVLGIGYSPIRGPEGNIEYLGYLRSGINASCDIDTKSVVAASHSNLE